MLTGDALTSATCRFRVLTFMHSNLNYGNIRMDGASLYREPRHPADPTMTRDFTKDAKPCSRSRRPVKYFLVNFGLSRRYDPVNGPPLEEPGLFNDQSVPELRSDDPCDPFLVDVYRIGNVVREVIEVRP